jgi:hypothetical protein
MEKDILGEGFKVPDELESEIERVSIYGSIDEPHPGGGAHA